ncbi:MAG: hypothetical protein ACREBE_17955 [bacterium]
MASSITFPLSLPQIAEVSYDQLDGRVTFQTDIGPAKTRRRYTAVPKLLSGKFVLTAQQAIEFNSFYDVTLAGGTLTFNWEDPLTDAPVEMFFKSRGKLQLYSGGKPTERVWFVDVVLEIRGAA